MKLDVIKQTKTRQRGYSLMELMITSGIGMLALSALASFSVFTARSFVAIGNYSDLDRTSRHSLDTMTRDIREAKALTEYTVNRLAITTSDDKALTYEYFPKTGRLIRQKGQEVAVMLQECDEFTFNIYQRTPSNEFTFYPVQSNHVDLAKLVDVTWRCSRKILGDKINTESVQTAKIVMRN